VQEAVVPARGAGCELATLDERYAQPAQHEIVRNGPSGSPSPDDDDMARRRRDHELVDLPGMGV
jgi:hypothetical protein